VTEVVGAIEETFVKERAVIATAGGEISGKGAKGAGSGKKSGKVLVEELWVFGKKPNAEAMFMEALGGQVSRDEGWVIYLTTQSDDPPAGIFKQKLQYWRDVRDGVIVDPKTLGILYESQSGSYALAFLQLDGFAVPAPAQVTQTVRPFRLQVPTANKNFGEVESQPLQH
jgi:hypothetical protein